MPEQKKDHGYRKINKWLRILLISLGMTALVLGIIGIFIPVLPTTPFILLAAALFARSSQRFYMWLIENRFFGRYIRDYREGRGIPLRLKAGAIALLWITIGLSIVFALDMLFIRLMLAVIAVGVTLHIAFIRKR